MQSNFRPIFHFSPPQGWTNDPNGLVWHDGWWHLFYQHMPTETHWGPMHWGHAASRDLTHWEARPIALYPDELGGIFSGSAAVNDDARGELVACFTHASETSQSQSLAFSRDGGDTWGKYADNPVLTLERPEFRDPKVFRHNGLWLMIVAAGFEAQLYASPDLLDWQLLSTVAAPQRDWVWECPDLFEVDGQWILIASFIRPGSKPASGNGTYYFLGEFDGATFTPHGAPRPLSFGPDDYAAVSWGNAPGDARIIIGWMSHWFYAAATPTESEGWRGAMTLPRELSLRDGNLLQNPPRVLAAQRGEKLSFDDNALSFRGDAYEFEAEIDVSQLTQPQAGFRLRIGDGEATRVFYDAAREELGIDRTQSGQVDFHDGFSGVWKAPLALKNGVLKLHVFVDKCSVEVFAQGGALYGAALIFPSPQSLGIEFFGDGARVVHGAIYPFE